MAQSLRKSDIPDKPARAARLVPVPRRELPAITEDLRQPSTSVHDKVADAKNRIKNAIITVRSRLSDTYWSGRARTASSYRYVANSSRSLASRTASQVRRAKEEHPLQLLAYMGGAAFVAGLAIRIWRSRHE